MIEGINQANSAGNLKIFFLFIYESVCRFFDIRYLLLVDTLDWTGFTIYFISVEVVIKFLFEMFCLFPNISNYV